MAAPLHYWMQEATVRVSVLALTFVAYSSTVSWAQSPTDAQPVTTSARAEASRAARATDRSSSPEATGLQEAGEKVTRFQVGVSIKTTLTPAAETGSSITPTFLWRWRGTEAADGGRWSPAYGLSSYTSRVTSPMAARELPVGDIQVRPVMVGLDYKVPRGRWRWAAGVSAGWAVNDVKTPAAYQTRITRTMGADDLWVDVHNSFVWGPRVTGWFERDRRVSYLVEGAYMVTRPELDVHVNGVSTTRRIRADAAVFRVGVVYGIY